MKRSRPALAVAAVAAALALTSCGSDSGSGSGSTTGSDEEVTISYTNFISNGGNEDNLDTIVNAFEEANPGITVDVTTMAYEDYFTALQTDIAAGTTSDVYDIEYANYADYQDAGAFAEVDVADPDAFDTTLLKTYQTDGTQYALPTSFSNVVLFYNKAMFDAAGLDYPTADWTWADEQAAAEAMTQADAGVFGDYQPISYNEFYKVLEQNGSSFLSEDGTEVGFDNAAGVEAVEWLVGKSGTTMPTAEQGAGTADFDSGLFHDGKLAMFHSGIWMFGTFADMTDDWDIVVEPGNTRQASAMFSNAVAVSSSSDHPVEAGKLAEFLAGSDTSAEVRLEAGWELPPTSDETVMAQYLDQGKPAGRQAVLDSLESVALAPDLRGNQEKVADIVDAALGEAAAGRTTAQQAVDTMTEKINDILG